MMRYSLAIAPLLLLAAHAANAVVITFDSATDMGIVDTATHFDGFSFCSDHYHFNTPRSGEAWNGTSFIGEEGGGRGGAITMNAIDGSTFSLFSFDASEFLPGYGLDTDFPNANFIDVQGLLADGGSVIMRLTLDGIADGRWGADDFQSFTLDDRFTNLLSVTFQGLALDGREGGLALDNISVGASTSVPEPGSLSIMALGLLGAGFAGRRKRQAGK
jgi:hypothetical protein